MSTDDRPTPYALFMLLLSLGVLIELVLFSFNLVSDDVAWILRRMDTAACAVFLVDALVGFVRAESKLQWMKWGWIDVLSSIPEIEAFRWARVGRVLRIMRVLKGARVLRELWVHGIKQRGESAILASGLISFACVTFGAIAVLVAESGAGGPIQGPEDALWWTVVTITTVGYGDLYPVTEVGRGVAVVLMVTGVSTFGAFSGFLASSFLGGDEGEREAATQRQQDSDALIREMAARLERLEAALARTEGRRA